LLRSNVLVASRDTAEDRNHSLHGANPQNTDYLHCNATTLHLSQLSTFGLKQSEDQRKARKKLARDSLATSVTTAPSKVADVAFAKNVNRWVLERQPAFAADKHQHGVTNYEAAAH
jgi:hypothetical protein